MTDEELREKSRHLINIIVTRGGSVEELITLITKEKAGEIFDQCMEAAINIGVDMRSSAKYINGAMHMKSNIIKAIEQERKRYE